MTVQYWQENFLSYADNMVNLFVANDSAIPPMTEIMRVLTPLGVACIKHDDGLNQWVLNSSTVVGGRTLENLWRTPNVKGASEVMFFGDCAITGATPLASDQPPQFDGDCANVWGTGGSTNEIRRFCMNRHDGSMSGLFLDSTVRKVGLKELWTLRWHREFDTTGFWTKAGGAKPEDWPQWMRHFKDY